ncbi:hypothetical protein WA158_005590 [Blastocystis sp. Blastoise]
MESQSEFVSKPMNNTDSNATLRVKFQLNERAKQPLSAPIFNLLTERKIDYSTVTHPTDGDFICIVGTFQQISETVCLIKEEIVQVPTDDELAELEVPSDQHNEIIVRFEVPDSYIGGLIGKSGSGIQLIRRYARCRIYLEPQNNNETERRIKLCGNSNNVFDTIHKILHRLLFLRPSLGQLPTSFPELEEYVQSIIGKQASYPPIQRGSTDNSVLSSPLQSFSPSTLLSSIALPTTNQQELINNNPSKTHDLNLFRTLKYSASITTFALMTTTSLIDIPVNKAGHIIGKGGEKIKRFRKTADCQISIEEIPDVPKMRKLRLSGTILQVCLAERLILEAIQESFL